MGRMCTELAVLRELVCMGRMCTELAVCQRASLHGENVY